MGNEYACGKAIAAEFVTGATLSAREAAMLVSIV